MTNYSAEDGLKVLLYLGMGISDEETTAFREKWAGFYQMRNGNLISATWTLYSQLPFICGLEEERAALRMSRGRDQEFGERLEKTPLAEQLKSGAPLDKIIADSPERFASWN